MVLIKAFHRFPRLVFSAQTALFYFWILNPVHAYHGSLEAGSIAGFKELLKAGGAQTSSVDQVGFIQMPAEFATAKSAKVTKFAPKFADDKVELLESAEDNEFEEAELNEGATPRLNVFFKASR